ncbi:hypothetical protein [Kitasatospora sp. GP82]|uniref:hypothetical protein n=1 Tax=Kitasatospora sp. GP82 TaxID=3035089 RepID=UPI0024756DB2|nr:hypothetical protein [Kitasatospora sp. GP82]
MAMIVAGTVVTLAGSASANTSSTVGSITSVQSVVRPQDTGSAPDTIDGLYASDWYSPCWTSFNPSSPGGAPMNHYYINCENKWVVVCPAVTVNGALSKFTSWAVKLAPYGDSSTGYAWGVDWHYWSTIHNGYYTTVFC